MHRDESPGSREHAPFLGSPLLEMEAAGLQCHEVPQTLRESGLLLLAACV